MVDHRSCGRQGGEYRAGQFGAADHQAGNVDVGLVVAKLAEVAKAAGVHTSY